MTLCVAKRKRSSDAVSDSGTCSHTEQTEASTPRREVDAKSRMLAQTREEHVEKKLQLEDQIKQLQEQKQHIAVQLQQLEGCDCSRDVLGISDLSAQLQDYEYQEEQAQEQLTGLNKQFEATVADILGIAAEQQASQLAQAVLEQQQLQEAEVQQLVVEQQLARPGFAVTDSSKHQAKKARLDRMSQVWDWLHCSGAADAGAPAATAGKAAGEIAGAPCEAAGAVAAHGTVGEPNAADLSDAVLTQQQQQQELPVLDVLKQQSQLQHEGRGQGLAGHQEQQVEQAQLQQQVSQQPEQQHSH